MRFGAFGVLPAVDECRSSPTLGREWGVDEPSAKFVGGKYRMMPVLGVKYGSKTLMLYHHPKLLVPESIKRWEQEYIYSGDSYGMVPFLDRHPCALEAKEIYDGACSIFRTQIKARK